MSPVAPGTSKYFPTLYKTIEVEGLEIFYREAGLEGAPTIILLHGFPKDCLLLHP